MHFYLMLLASPIFLQLIEANKWNVSYADLQFCKEYDVKAGYKYTSFFHIESLKPSQIITDSEDTIINLKLFVLAAKDAHILLSPTDQIKSSPIYEIVLGAGGNTFNEIRRQRQSQPLTTLRVKSFLSPTDVMPLTVRILKAGNISVSITGQPPFITAFDPNVIDIKYMSFSTWGTAEGKWFYDCESDVNGNKLSPIKENLTDIQRLQKDLLDEYDASIAPFDLDTVMLDFDLANVNFNAKKSFMISRGRFRASWIDNKLIWNESVYGGKKWLHLKNVEAYQFVWTPSVRLLNGKDDNFVSLPLFYSVTIFSNGSIWAESNECTFSTWCFNSNQNWPYELVDCDIQIQLDHFINAKLIPLDKMFSMVPKNSRFYEFDEGEWRIIDTTILSTAQSNFYTPYAVTDERLVSHSTVLKIDVNLERNRLFYKQLISAPLIGSFLLILFSFWVQRFLRIMLNAISLFILVAMLLILVDHGPNNYTPTVVVYYTCSLFMAWASLLTFTIHCWFKERKPNIELFTQIASSTWIQLLLCMNIVDSYEYKEIEEESTNDFSQVIDRLLFFIFLMIFFICVVVDYY